MHGLHASGEKFNAQRGHHQILSPRDSDINDYEPGKFESVTFELTHVVTQVIKVHIGSGSNSRTPKMHPSAAGAVVLQNAENLMKETMARCSNLLPKIASMKLIYVLQI